MCVFFYAQLTLVGCWLPRAGYTTPVRDICMFALICSVSGLFSVLFLFMRGT